MKEVERYTKAVEQKRLAVAASEQPVRAENKIVPTLTRKVGTNADFFNLCKGTLAG